ncbi:GDSL-type esterase/lipase family protein [Streptomyces sp. MN03-5084-2B]|nr:GDSL-type esterase/lipase family protein [Streptomyces sp. MN03-5084-2B]
MKRWIRRTGLSAAYLAVVAASVSAAVVLAPAQEVSVAGQTILVGAVRSPAVSGPGELDLFGQRLPTALRFPGPIRPRLELSRLTLTSELADLVDSPRPADRVGRALAGGWTRYVLAEAAIAGGCALLLSGALAGWLRMPRRRAVLTVVAAVLAVEAVNAGAVTASAVTAQARLSEVSSLGALVGRTKIGPVPSPSPGPASAAPDAVVIGDSTAAGVGNPLVPNPSAVARACGRSVDSYASALSGVTGRRVLDLACSGATIPAGLLGAQRAGQVTVPPQLDQVHAAGPVRTVIVSIGADDLQWATLLRLCAAKPTCDDNASTAYFQQQLAGFAVDYADLLRRLANLPAHPRILINLYYNPFDPGEHCLDRHGLTPAKQRSLIALLDALNNVLGNGARAAGATPVLPDFTGHQLCDRSPYVQGSGDPAPFHPNPAGELAIALADDHVLASAP